MKRLVGFDRLRRSKWCAADSELLKSYFKGNHREWSKKTLSGLRRSLRDELLSRQRYRCAYCRRTLSAEIGHNEIDHVVAKSLPKMGKFTYEKMNLVACCKRCNKNKGNHNPLSSRRIGLQAYPLDADDYIWVHPYIHKYSDHIRIRQGLLFEAVGAGATRERGRAVILRCKLSELKTVERRRLEESIGSAQSAYLAFLSVCGDSRFTPRELAGRLRANWREMRVLSLLEVERAVLALRAGDLDTIARTLANIVPK